MRYYKIYGKMLLILLLSLLTFHLFNTVIDYSNQSVFVDYFSINVIDKFLKCLIMAKYEIFLII